MFQKHDLAFKLKRKKKNVPMYLDWELERKIYRITKIYYFLNYLFLLNVWDVMRYVEGVDWTEVQSGQSKWSLCN